MEKASYARSRAAAPRIGGLDSFRCLYVVIVGGL